MSKPTTQGRVRAAEVCLPSHDLAADLSYFTTTLGFRLDTIFPADDPAVARLSGDGRATASACESSAAHPSCPAYCGCSATIRAHAA